MLLQFVFIVFEEESVFNFGHEIATAKLKRYKLPGSDEIPAGGEILHSKIRKLINFIWNKKEFPDHWKESYYYTSSQEG
jgi:hypothetical protein